MIMTLAELADRINSPTWRGHVTEFPFKSRAGQEDPFGPEQRAALRLNLAEVATDLSKVHQGDRVVVQTESSVRAFLAAVAIWARGGVVVPVDLGSGQRQLDQVIGTVKASYVYNSQTGEIVEGHRTKGYKQFVIRSKPRVRGSDLALIIPTSSSTGVPKGVMLTNFNVNYFLYSIIRYLELNDHD